MKSLLVFLLVAIARWKTSAQAPNLILEHLTTKEGLPSNDVWCLTKDRQGFLWIGTGRNICRYDGYRFQSPDTLKLGYCSGVSTDSKGDVFASIDTRGLCKIDSKTGKITTLLQNNYDDTDTANDLHEQVTVDSYDQAWMCDYNSVKRYDIARKKLHTYSLVPSPSGSVYQYASFFEDAARTLWVVSEIGLYRYDRPRNKLTCVLGKGAANPKNRISVRLNKAFEDTAGTLWLGAYESGLIRFSPQTQAFTILKKGFENNHVLCGLESKDENGQKLLFVGTENGVSVYYPDRNELHHLAQFANSGIHVKALFDDKANGIVWMGTREGIYKYRYRNAGIRTVDLPASAVRLPVQVTSFLPMPQGTYLLGLSHSGALAWQPATNQFRLQPYPVSAFTHRLRWIQNRPVAFTDQGIFVRDTKTGQFEVWSPAARLFTTRDFRDGLLDRRGRIWLANIAEGLKVIDPTSGNELKLWSEKAARRLFTNNFAKALLEGGDGRIWVATCSNGLYFFDEKARDFVNVESLPVNKGVRIGGECINSLAQGPGGSILIACWGGISKLSATGQILTNLDYRSDALNDTYCSNLAEVPGGTLWFSTNEGIHIVDSKTRKIKYLTTIEGLRSNYPVGFLYAGGNDLLLGHTNVINVLTINQLNSVKAMPKIALSSVEVGGKSLLQDPARDITLRPDENSITFNFSALNFEPASQNRYAYCLEGYDERWVNLGNQRTVSFSNLPADSYRLRVKSGNGAGVWSDTPLSINLRVKPFFTNTWWFRTLLGVFFGTVIAGLVRWRVATLADRNRMDLQVTELKLKALQSQMNPHFLFNSLNSVQNFLLTNQGLEGAKYLSKFSKLVRRIMENSNHPYLRFEQIIDTLRMYVEIESFRFNHEFSYEFDIADDEVLLDAFLPPMLLQPYVENAIWHGLMPKEGKKKLCISARIENHHLVCTIEDNGVGRTFAPRKEGHISRGQEMTEGIFDSLRRNRSQARLDVLDLYDAENRPAGTRVAMTIPLERG